MNGDEKHTSNATCSSILTPLLHSSSTGGMGARPPQKGEGVPHITPLELLEDHNSSRAECGMKRCVAERGGRKGAATRFELDSNGGRDSTWEDVRK